MVQDPVCGVETNPLQAAATSEYQGQVYYFCSEACKQLFERNPHAYITQDAA